MWYFAPQTGYSEAYLGKAGSDSLFFMEDGGPTEKQAVVLAEALNVHEQTGLTPSQLSADLAAAQQEIARLRAALEKLQPGIEAMGWMTDELRDMLK